MSVTDPEWLKAELAKPGRSQSALARHMGLDASAINRLVNGGREMKAREIEAVEEYLAATDEADTDLFRSRLRERIKAVGKSPRSISLEAGLSPEALRLILSGRAKSPRLSTVASLARVLGCDVNYLAASEEEAALPQNLRIRMAEMGLNPFSLAQKAGLGPDAIRDIFRGKAKNPGGVALAKIADALDTTIDRLLARNGAAPDGASGPPSALAVSAGRVTLNLTAEVSISTAVRILALIDGDTPNPLQEGTEE